MPEPGVAAPLPWLVADVGGTHARFGLVEASGGGVRHVQALRTADFDGPAEAARAYLDARRADGALAHAPRAAAFAVATPIGREPIALTNARWSFTRAQLRAALGVERLRVLNDFEALALSLPALPPEHLRVLGPWPPPDGTRAVVGPGTGLGVAGLVRTPCGWHAVAGEGGHATLAAGDDYEQAVVAHARREFEHVSAERLLSGIGLPVLHRAVAAVEGIAAPALDAPAIVQAALDGGDALAARTLDTFCALLGSFAGNVALTFGARGGLYVGGGIVPRFAERFAASRFRARFEAKGRFAPYLAAIPTPLIVDPHATLAGAAAALGAAPDA
ncbi:glucokinase [Azohydromonas sediminis]|uniref:glucokinase n=1 Tax=Azohydromonas sediminis TaxID=2259674 RepID=UPI000E64CCC7|nr:glucokinase [Azohydromonas sediminis]